MLERWTGEVIGIAHIHQIPLSELAGKVGISRQALSAYLNGHKKSPSAEFRIRSALMELVEAREASDASH